MSKEKQTESSDIGPFMCVDMMILEQTAVEQVLEKEAAAICDDGLASSADCIGPPCCFLPRSFQKKES